MPRSKALQLLNSGWWTEIPTLNDAKRTPIKQRHIYPNLGNIMSRVFQLLIASADPCAWVLSVVMTAVLHDVMSK